MAVVDSCYLLCQKIASSCDSYVETLALVGAWYTVRKCLGLIRGSYNLIRVHFIPRLFRQTDLVKQYGPWAVITGATAGIGKAYAEELARRGVNVFLISRDRAKLTNVSQAIAETYKVKTAFIVADFSKGHEIYPSIKKALNDVEIGILVNNVGVFYDHPQYFTLVPEEKVWDIVNVNVAAATMMVHIVLPGMVDRKKGAIVNVSSVACNVPGPLMAQYSASKAYLDNFSRSLQYEYASSRIFIQSLTPFVVATNMSAFIGRPHNSPWFVPSASVYARHAVSTLGVSTRNTGYWSHHLQCCVQTFLPEWLWAFVISTVNHHLRKEALSCIRPKRNPENC